MLAILLFIYQDGVSLTRNRGSGNPVVTTCTSERVVAVCNRDVQLSAAVHTVATPRDECKVNWKVVEGSGTVVLVQPLTAHGRVQFSYTQFRRLRKIAKSDC